MALVCCTVTLSMKHLCSETAMWYLEGRDTADCNISERRSRSRRLLGGVSNATHTRKVNMCVTKSSERAKQNQA